MKNSIFLSDKSINSIPGSSSFFNCIFPLAEIEHANYNLLSLDSKKFPAWLDETQVELQKCNYYYKDNNHYLNQTLGENARGVSIKDTYDVEYKLNSYFFRCDQFKNSHDSIHLLFAGCSETFGEGGDVEDVWAKRLYNKLSETNNFSGYFNLGLPGANWHQIMINIKRYIKLFGPPDILLIFAPNLLRYYEYTEKNNLKTDYWQAKVFNQPTFLKSSKEYFKKYKEMFVPWLLSLQNFIDYCNSINIKVVWSTWATQENINITRTKYFENSFFPTWDIHINENTINDIEIKPQDVFRRDLHSGDFFHCYIANEFMKELTRLNYVTPPLNYYDVPIDPIKVQND